MNGISAFLIAFIVIGVILVFFTIRSIIKDDDEFIDRINVFGRLRGCLTSGGGFDVGDIIPRILILIMSAGSVAIIVRAVILVVNAVTEFSKNGWENLDWVIDLMSDVPVMNVAWLLKQIHDTQFRADYFAMVLLLSLVVMGFASAIVQLIMALINKFICQAQEDSMFFKILGFFSITTLTVAGTIFISSLISPLIDLSDDTAYWFVKLCRPLSLSSVGNILLQVLVTVVLFALLIILCFDWVKALVLGAVSMIALFIIFQLPYTILFKLFGADVDGGGSLLWGSFETLLFFLYPIFDFFRNFDDKESHALNLVSVIVSGALSILITLVATIIGQIDPVGNFFMNDTMFITSTIVFIVYILAMPGIEIAMGSDD